MKFRVVLIEPVPGTDFPWSSWYWRLMSAGNNKTLAHSELYRTRHDATRTAAAVADQLGVILETATD